MGKAIKNDDCTEIFRKKQTTEVINILNEWIKEYMEKIHTDRVTVALVVPGQQFSTRNIAVLERV